MNIPIFSRTLLFSTLALSSSLVSAVDIRFNGFASFVGGQVLKDNGNVFVADPGDSIILGQSNPDAVYNDDISFRPDSVYGLKLFADLDEGLTATAQIVGRGAKDFDADIEWAFLAYELGGNFSIQAGRQRLPIFNYASFLDVGYAYHWIRPPVAVYADLISTYDGFTLVHSGQIGEWESTSRIYGGDSRSQQSSFGDLFADNLVGFEWRLQNEWLALRASSLMADVAINNPLSTTGLNNPTKITFSAISADFTLGNGFIGAEATLSEPREPNEVVDTGLIQVAKLESYMVTTGYRFGDFTPHVTYSEQTLTLGNGLQTGYDAVSTGLRWDFHPSAAFKIEYTLNSDTSDQLFILASPNGAINDVDVISFGFDIVF